MTAFAQIVVKDLGDSVKNYQTGSSSEFMIFVIILLTVLALAIAVWWVVRRRSEQRRPLQLFYDLADYHEIPRKEQRRVLHLARAHGVEDPACFFVCPELVARIESLEASEAGGEKESRRIEELFAGFRKAAFGDLPGATEEAGGGE
jgi:hypothetical protein